LYLLRGTGILMQGRGAKRHPKPKKMAHLSCDVAAMNKWGDPMPKRTLPGVR